jgi:quinol monooxygenase YgiN
MILVIMEMTTLTAKRKEFFQTVQALIKSIRKEKGCIKCSACQDVENENTFCMIQGWETQKELDRYLQSDLFEVLLGTKNFLREPWEINFNTVLSTAGIEAGKYNHKNIEI